MDSLVYEKLKEENDETSQISRSDHWYCCSQFQVSVCLQRERMDATVAVMLLAVIALSHVYSPNSLPKGRTTWSPEVPLRWVKASSLQTRLRLMIWSCSFVMMNHIHTTRYKCTPCLHSACNPSVQLLLHLAVIPVSPVKLVALGQHETLQVLVLSPILQPLLIQYRDQHVPLLHCPHDLGQDLLLLLQLRGTLLRVWMDVQREEWVHGSLFDGLCPWLTETSPSTVIRRLRSCCSRLWVSSSSSSWALRQKKTKHKTEWPQLVETANGKSTSIFHLSSCKSVIQRCQTRGLRPESGRHIISWGVEGRMIVLK